MLLSEVVCEAPDQSSGNRGVRGPHGLPRRWLCEETSETNLWELLVRERHNFLSEMSMAIHDSPWEWLFRMHPAGFDADHCAK